MVRSHEARELLFEAPHPFAENVLGGRRDLVEGSVDLLLDRVVLRYEVDERDYSCPLARAGTPATVSPGPTSRVTTAPAPTIARAPIRTSPMTIEPDPSQAPRSTTVRSSFQSCSVFMAPDSSVARGNLSLVNRVPWPTKTSSSISTPSQMNAWLSILQFAPTMTPRWISTNGPICVLSPMRQP